MKKEIIAYHEAGHAVACILVGIKFKYVSLSPDPNNTTSEGHIRILNYNRKNPRKWSLPIMGSTYYFRRGFAIMGGPVAQIIKENKKKTSLNWFHYLGDYMSLKESVCKEMYPTLESKFIAFLFEYTLEVLKSEYVWKNIESVAEYLLKNDNIYYSDVLTVIKQNPINQFRDPKLLTYTIFDNFGLIKKKEDQLF